MESLLIKLLKKEVKPAMGCTEPIAVALASAKAKEILGTEKVNKIEVTVSPNIYKNGLAVGIPHTSYVGLDIAALIGFYQGNSKYGLEVLKEVEEEALPDLEKIKKQMVELSISDTTQKVYINVKLISDQKTAIATIEKTHDHFSYLMLNDKMIYEGEFEGTTDQLKTDQFFDLSIKEIIDVIELIDYKEIEFLYDGYEMNKKMAMRGLEKKVGLGIGNVSNKLATKGIFSSDLAMQASILTSAASDARMSGINLPVMSSNGSGNNGLTAILPIVAYAEGTSVEKEKILKAIALSHLINSYIKKEIGRLSAMCSCSVSAGAASSAALVWLMGGTQKQIEGTIKNMIGNVSGMICDGAKESCALKLSTAAQLSVQSAYLALENVIIGHRNGIVNKCVEKSIENLGVLSKEGMQLTDRMILNIMINND